MKDCMKALKQLWPCTIFIIHVPVISFEVVNQYRGCLLAIIQFLTEAEEFNVVHPLQKDRIFTEVALKMWNSI